MNNGFVENLDINQGMIGDDIKDRIGKVQDGDIKANSEHQNNELSVYERLLKGNVAIQFDPAISENIGMNDIEENKTINTSMNAVMDVLGDDNFSQKMKNDSSMMGSKNERIGRVEDELQTRQKSRSEREYSQKL